MYPKALIRFFNFFSKGFCLTAFLLLANHVSAQRPMVMTDQADQHIFTATAKFNA